MGGPIGALLIFFWICWAIVCAAVGESRDRSGIRWLLGTLVLPPLGVAVLFLPPPGRCSVCAEPIRKAARKCPHCGVDVEPREAAPLDADETLREARIRYAKGLMHKAKERKE
jgi:hypothetical protein